MLTVVISNDPGAWITIVMARQLLNNQEWMRRAAPTTRLDGRGLKLATLLLQWRPLLHTVR